MQRRQGEKRRKERVSAHQGQGDRVSSPGFVCFVSCDFYRAGCHDLGVLDMVMRFQVFTGFVCFVFSALPASLRLRGFALTS